MLHIYIYICNMRYSVGHPAHTKYVYIILRARARLHASFIKFVFQQNKKKGFGHKKKSFTLPPCTLYIDLHYTNTHTHICLYQKLCVK